MLRRVGNHITISEEDGALESFLDQTYMRIPGQLAWTADDSLLDKVGNVLGSVLSGRTTPEVILIRKGSCFGNTDKGTPPCPALRMDVDGSFCDACGCGRWGLANLDGTILPKLGWAHLNCPLKRPGFSNSAKETDK